MIPFCLKGCFSHVPFKAATPLTKKTSFQKTTKQLGSAHLKPLQSVTEGYRSSVGSTSSMRTEVLWAAYCSQGWTKNCYFGHVRTASHLLEEDVCHHKSKCKVQGPDRQFNDSSNRLLHHQTFPNILGGPHICTVSTMLKSNRKPSNIDYIFQYESKQARKQEIMKEPHDIKPNLPDLQSLNQLENYIYYRAIVLLEGISKTVQEDSNQLIDLDGVREAIP